METYFDNMTAQEGSRERLIQDLKVLLHDAEDLIKAAGEDLSEHTREELAAIMEKIKLTCRRIEQKAVASARTTDRMIRENLYQSIGISFGLGLLIGILVNRR